MDYFINMDDFFRQMGMTNPISPNDIYTLEEDENGVWVDKEESSDK